MVPKINFPERFKAAQKAIPGLTAIRQVKARNVVLPPTGLARIIHLRQELGAGLRLDCAGMVDSGEGDPEVIAVGEGNLNQVLEHRILEYPPPGEISQRVGRDLICRVAITNRRIHLEFGSCAPELSVWHSKFGVANFGAAATTGIAGNVGKCRPAAKPSSQT